MKNHTLLATFTFLALNAAAFGQWHTNAPFVAWPATNHLRWMTNVVVATNQSTWTGTNGYGAWTNNYLFVSNVWAAEIWTDLDSEFPHFDFAAFRFRLDNFGMYPEGYATLTNMFLQAKDVRVFDCELALIERWSVLGTNNSVSNYHEFAQTYYPDYGRVGAVYNTERLALRRCRTAAKNLLPYYYLQASNEFPIVCTESAICARAGAPSNFLSNVEMYRAPDGTWTPYSRIITSRWTLAGTTNTVVTNVTVDSWGGAVTLIGTNGQQFSQIVTNTAIAPGKRAEDYGWDTMKAIITNLTMTAKDATWGIGFGTNSPSDAVKSNAPVTWSAYTTPLDIPDATNQAIIDASIVATNGWPVNGDGNGDPFNPIPWAWWWTNKPLSSLVQTGQPPASVFDAKYQYSCYNILSYAKREGGSITWDAGLSTNRLMTHTNQWKNYNAPLVAPSYGPFVRTVDFYLLSNSVPMLWQTTNVSAGNHLSVTSAPFGMPTPPIPSTFGLDVDPAGNVTWAGLESIYYTRGSTYSGTTNIPYPSITATKAFERWEFLYK